MGEIDQPGGEADTITARRGGTVPAIDQAEPEPGEEEFYLVVDS